MVALFRPVSLCNTEQAWRKESTYQLGAADGQRQNTCLRSDGLTGDGEQAPALTSAFSISVLVNCRITRRRALCAQLSFCAAFRCRVVAEPSLLPPANRSCAVSKGPQSLMAIEP